ncbi:MAG TPA: hypothetical protein PLE30_03105 [Candidatus Kapabacteria bacterium]|nr:hypothetical protein [Candidatus Kapabacteria bacterium]
MLVAFCFNLLGVFILYKYELANIRNSIKQLIKAGIPNEELHCFTLSISEYNKLDWTRDSKEFRCQNRMYDIVHKSVICDTIKLLCVNDKEEETLFAKLDDLLLNKLRNDSQKAKNPINSINKILKLICILKNNSDVLNKFKILKFPIKLDKKSFYTCPIIEILTPPPNNTLI